MQVSAATHTEKHRNAVSDERLETSAQDRIKNEILVVSYRQNTHKRHLRIIRESSAVSAELRTCMVGRFKETELFVGCAV